jgi:hypothetical protein
VSQCVLLIEWNVFPAFEHKDGVRDLCLRNSCTALREGGHRCSGQPEKRSLQMGICLCFRGGMEERIANRKYFNWNWSCQRLRGLGCIKIGNGVTYKNILCARANCTLFIPVANIQRWK